MFVNVLFNGYSKEENGKYLANCSCVLIKGPPNVIVDTMTAWDGTRLLESLKNNDISPDEIHYVVCTHGHSDHIGYHDFKNGAEYVISDIIKVIPTPGHTLQDVSVIVNDEKEGTIAITGDLFEKFEDLMDDSIWKLAGSDDEKLQELNRKKILALADVIIPGHGKKFNVPKYLKTSS